MRIGINGFGRIGRLVFRIIETKRLEGEEIKIVAVNCSMTNQQFLQHLQYDSSHGKFLVNSTYSDEKSITINNNKVFRFNERSPENINWDEANVEYVIDCTGVFKTMEKAKLHLHSKKIKNIIISSPSNDIPMYVMGVNHTKYNGEIIVSNASCTTNCLAPLAKIIHKNFKIKNALMSTIHATTSSQNTLDNKSRKNLRLGRCCLNNIIPSTTGAAKCVGKVIPDLEGKINGVSLRVPTPNVSAVDLTVHLEKSTSYEEIMKCLEKAEKSELKGILRVCDKELVSSDFIGDSHSCIVDEKAGIELNETFFKIVAWYDNEWGYSHRLVDLLEYIK
jgi:glyceraldehyde 3-phosphate dehydrogenase